MEEDDERSGDDADAAYVRRGGGAAKPVQKAESTKGATKGVQGPSAREEKPIQPRPEGSRAAPSLHRELKEKKRKVRPMSAGQGWGDSTTEGRQFERRTKSNFVASSRTSATLSEHCLRDAQPMQESGAFFEQGRCRFERQERWERMECMERMERMAMERMERMERIERMELYMQRNMHMY